MNVVSQIASDDQYHYGFNGQMKTNEWAGVGNHNTALFWEYDTRTGVRMNRDPKGTVWESPYSTFGRNPIRFSDNLGDTIKVGDKIYTPGMSEDGTSGFEKVAISNLNRLNSVKNGVILLKELSNSKKNYDIINKIPVVGGKKNKQTLVFEEYKNGGGKIEAASLLNDLPDLQHTGSLAHELFHGYQHLHGERGESVNLEVGAYLFEKGIVTSLNGGYTLGNSSVNGKLYSNAMSNLLFSPQWDNSALNDYKTAVKNFIKGSESNQTGIYNQAPVLPVKERPVISNFFPLSD
jgi:hypothetical protein